MSSLARIMKRLVTSIVYVALYMYCLYYTLTPPPTPLSYCLDPPVSLPSTICCGVRELPSQCSLDLLMSIWQFRSSSKSPRLVQRLILQSSHFHDRAWCASFGLFLCLNMVAPHLGRACLSSSSHTHGYRGQGAMLVILCPAYIISIQTGLV